MNKLRELFSDTLIYGISSVAARFLNYILVPFHTGVFDKALYSIVGLVYAAITFLNVIFTMGMESAYLRYAKDRNEAPHIFKTLQFSLLGFASILVGVIWLAEPLILSNLNLDDQTSGIFLMMLGILWFDTLSIIPFAELRLVRKSILFAVLRSSHVVINLVLNFYLILNLGFGIEAVFISNLIASVFVTVIIGFFTMPMLRGNWNRYWVQKAFAFGWPFVPAGLGYAINETLDRFFLNAMDPERVQLLYGADYTPEDIVGIYNACYKVGVFMLLLIQMFRMAWQPFFMRYSDDPDAPRIFGRTFIYFNLVAAAIYLIIGLFTEEIVSIRLPILDMTLIHSDYWLGLEIVPLLLLAYWFHGWYMNFSAGIFISEKTDILPRVMLIGAFITIIANLILVPISGMTGSACATVLSYGVMALTLYHFSKKQFNVPYRPGFAIILMVLMAGAVWSVPVLSRVFLVEELTVKILLLITGMTGIGMMFVKELKKDEEP